ncbi:MAG TPA: DUF3106 domain-containing protein [Edaphobacter sp.]
MRSVSPIRRALASFVFTTTLACVPAISQQGAPSHPSPAPRQLPAPRPFPGMGAHPGQGQGGHLPQWFDRHSNLTPSQQQKALEHEPGFRDLPPETQQRLRDRLTQLNNMPPEQRRRFLERNEAIANLSVPQRQQLRGAMQQYSSLPPDRRRQVARAFHDLRSMPESQRQSVLSSDRFRSQFSDQERGAISSLLAVEPLVPIRRPGENPDSGR